MSASNRVKRSRPWTHKPDFSSLHWLAEEGNTGGYIPVGSQVTGCQVMAKVAVQRKFFECDTQGHGYPEFTSLGSVWDEDCQQEKRQERRTGSGRTSSLGGERFGQRGGQGLGGTPGVGRGRPLGSKPRRGLDSASGVQGAARLDIRNGLSAARGLNGARLQPMTGLVIPQLQGASGLNLGVIQSSSPLTVNELQIGRLQGSASLTTAQINRAQLSTSEGLTSQPLQSVRGVDFSTSLSSEAREGRNLTTGSSNGRELASGTSNADERITDESPASDFGQRAGQTNGVTFGSRAGETNGVEFGQRAGQSNGTPFGQREDSPRPAAVSGVTGGRPVTAVTNTRPMRRTRVTEAKVKKYYRKKSVNGVLRNCGGGSRTTVTKDITDEWFFGEYDDEGTMKFGWYSLNTEITDDIDTVSGVTCGDGQCQISSTTPTTYQVFGSESGSITTSLSEENSLSFARAGVGLWFGTSFENEEDWETGALQFDEVLLGYAQDLAQPAYASSKWRLGIFDQTLIDRVPVHFQSTGLTVMVDLVSRNLVADSTLTQPPFLYNEGTMTETLLDEIESNEKWVDEYGYFGDTNWKDDAPMWFQDFSHYSQFVKLNTPDWEGEFRWCRIVSMDGRKYRLRNDDVPGGKTVWEMVESADFGFATPWGGYLPPQIYTVAGEGEEEEEFPTLFEVWNGSTWEELEWSDTTAAAVMIQGQRRTAAAWGFWGFDVGGNISNKRFKKKSISWSIALNNIGDDAACDEDLGMAAEASWIGSRVIEFEHDSRHPYAHEVVASFLNRQEWAGRNFNRDIDFPLPIFSPDSTSQTETVLTLTYTGQGQQCATPPRGGYVTKHGHEQRRITTTLNLVYDPNFEGSGFPAFISSKQSPPTINDGQSLWLENIRFCTPTIS